MGPTEPTLDDRIIEFLHGADWVTAEEIATSIGHNTDETNERLKQLADSGFVDHYRSGYPLKWGLSDQERRTPR